MTITAHRLKELFEYSPETGEFIRIKKTSSKTHIGTVAGTVNHHGYVIICIDYKLYSAHRLAWLYMTGEWPKEEVDHIDGHRSNNRFVNLRDVSVSMNRQNRRAADRKSKSGLLGVNTNKYSWAARIKVDGKKISLGSYPTPELAHAAYVEAKRKLHAGCTI